MHWQLYPTGAGPRWRLGLDGPSGSGYRQYSDYWTRENIRCLHQYIHRALRREAIRRRMDSIHTVLVLSRIW